MIASTNSDQCTISFLLPLKGSHVTSSSALAYARGVADTLRGLQGNEVDVHTVHFHGNVFVERGRHLDSFRMLPSVIRTTDLIADNPGTWLMHCHVRSHTDHHSAQQSPPVMANACAICSLLSSLPSNTLASGFATFRRCWCRGTYQP